MLSQNFINAWKEARDISFQIAQTMNIDKNFKLDFKPHPDMNSFGKTTNHLVGSIYYMFKNYLKQTEIKFPDHLRNQETGYDIFKLELDNTNKMVLDLFSKLTNEDMEQEAYYWEPTKRSYSKGWVVFNLINHERWTQAQLKMYLKLMGCDTSKIGH
jgi:hypothetical protein